MIVETERLLLVAITPEHAARILAGQPAEGETWHAEYPFEDELDPLRSHALVTAEPGVFTMYQVRTRADGVAVGGLGFFGGPDADGRVEVGYGLVPSARGRGYATEALRGAVAFAFANGARIVDADTEPGNTASQGVLRKAGFRETGRDAGAVRFRRVAGPEAASAQA